MLNPKNNNRIVYKEAEQKESGGKQGFLPQKKWVWIALLAVCSAAAVCVIAFVIVPMAAKPELVTTPSPIATPAPTPAPSKAAKPTPTPEPVMMPQMAELYQQNSDLAGWIKIDGTVVDYPVMYTQEENGEFYLYRTFLKEHDPTLCGTLFIDKNCSVDPRSTNLIIHGHNMRNGNMFQTLTNYWDEEFFWEHSSFEYSTLYETAKYEIAAVFLSKVYRQADDVFKFYQFYDAQTRADFDDFVKNIKDMELYETGITPEFGDELITLATCEFSQENGRLVVVARKVSDT